MGKFWGAFLGLLWLGVGSLSAFERGSHWVYLGGTPASAYAPNFLAPPVEAGLILGDSFTLGADASRSHFDLGHNEEDERYYRGMMSNGNMIGERWEILEYRLDLPTDAKANGVHQSSGAVGQTGLTAKGDYLATSQIQSLGIGTQWQTQIGLIIGMDWALGAQTNQESVTASIIQDPALTATQSAEALIQVQDFAQSINKLMASSGGLNLFIGWAF